MIIFFEWVLPSGPINRFSAAIRHVFELSAFYPHGGRGHPPIPLDSSNEEDPAIVLFAELQPSRQKTLSSVFGVPGR
jgi:hypothetical protein